MFREFIKLYTPFICAIVAIAHIFLYLNHYEGNIYSILGNITGHSVLMNIYIIIHSRRMCVWYKTTNYILMSIHFINIAYRIGLIPSYYIMYILLFINLSALMTWLIFRVTYKSTKAIRSACKRADTL